MEKHDNILHLSALLKQMAAYSYFRTPITKSPTYAYNKSEKRLQNIVAITRVRKDTSGELSKSISDKNAKASSHCAINSKCAMRNNETKQSNLLLHLASPLKTILNIII